MPSAATDSGGTIPVDATPTSSRNIGAAATSRAAPLRAFHATATPRISHNDGSKMKTASPKYQLLSTGYHGCTP